MSWSEYVKRVAPDARQADIASAAEVTGPTVSRWFSNQQKPDPAAAARFARAYGRPVLEAFVAAEFLTEAEAKVRPLAALDFSTLTNEELSELVRQRLTEGGEGSADATGGPAPTSGDDGNVTRFGPGSRRHQMSQVEDEAAHHVPEDDKEE